MVNFLSLILYPLPTKGPFLWLKPLYMRIAHVLMAEAPFGAHCVVVLQRHSLIRLMDDFEMKFTRSLESHVTVLQ